MICHATTRPLTFRPRHKYGLAWYHQANFQHFARGINLIWFSTTEPLSLFPTLVVSPLGTTLVESCTSAYLLCWYNNPNLFGLFASGHFWAQALCGQSRPDFLSGPSTSMPCQSSWFRWPQKVWELKQGVHHQLLLSHLRKYISSQSCSS
jgi:hypothetical protein